MNIRESFDLPGQSAPSQVIESLVPAPRPITLVGLNTDRLGLVLSLLFVASLSILFAAFLFDSYTKTASINALIAIFALLPITLVALPSYVLRSIKLRRQTFEHSADIYKNGIPAKGSIVMICYVSGNDYDNYFAPKNRKYTRLKKRVRIDYTFYVNNELKTGSVFIREKNAKYLACNDEICVLYKSDDPSQNILFPIPGEEFCSKLLKRNFHNNIC